MKVCRAGVFTLATLALSFAFTSAARADVRPLDQVQVLTRPATPVYSLWGQDAAVDGGHIIVLAAYDGGQHALLYRRSSSNGQFVFRRVLASWTGTFVRAQVAMRNGIAAVQFGDETSIFELSAGDYVRGTSSAPIRHHGGVAISAKRVLIGGNNCDYDAVLYEKNIAGSWEIMGRIDDNSGACFTPSQSYGVELQYDHAILHDAEERAGRMWQRNGTELTWVHGGFLPYFPDESVSEDASFALQGSTVVAPNGVIWRRYNVNGWSRQGELISVDHDNSYGVTFNVVYRDGVLLANETGYYRQFPRVYVETTPGVFEHVASMPFFDATWAEFSDVSGRTVIVKARNYDRTRQEVRIFRLPDPLPAPAPVVSDFEDRDVSDFSFAGGQFALATRGSDDVLAQNATSGIAIGLLGGTDWTDHQRVEADITPDFGGAGSWVGLVARYVDANNYYYLAVRSDETYGIYKRVGGVDTLLYERRLYNNRPPTFRAMLRIRGNRIDTHFSFQQGDTVTDNSLPHGRAGVITSSSRADFDDVHVAATDVYTLFSRDYSSSDGDRESGMEQIGGTWSIDEEGDEEVQWLTGLAQSDTSGSAVAIIGTPVPNQEIHTSMRLDGYASSPQGAWFGLLARYVDARNHYYVTVRSSGHIQIRKMVNGVITVLSSASFTAVPGQHYDVRFLVIEDQLQLFVDDALVASAHDSDIAIGKYGVASYRAAANWAWFLVTQP
jgi:hypothetical protein